MESKESLTATDSSVDALAVAKLGQSERGANLVESKRQPLWHLAVLNVLTFNSYSWIWFYKNWSELKKFMRNADEETKAKIAPGEPQQKAVRYLSKMNVLIHSLLLLLPFPFLNLFPAGIFFKQVADLYPKRETVFVRYSLLYALLCVAWVYWNLHEYDPKYLSTYYHLVLATIPLAVSQGLLNEFWLLAEDKNVYVRQAFSAGELLFIITGAAVIGLNITGVMSGLDTKI